MSSPARPAGAATASALLTDFYQLTMLDAYYQHDMHANASFEFFVRDLPPCRQFLLAAGLSQVLDYLESVRFTADEIAWLRSTGRFTERLLEQLHAFRFEGDVEAMPEGTVCFAGEPILRVTAPLPQAQLVESRIINLLQFQTVVATKAVRCRLAAPHMQLVDFGMRRAHGAEAALLAARACYLAGFDATATVEAGRCFGIPLVGTMAHSFIQAHESEIDAFRNFARSQPRNVTLLIDTYDTLRAAQRVTQLAPELRALGTQISAVRIDSGDLSALAHGVRDILDRGDCRSVKILVSGGLDEHDLQRFTAERSPIDACGLGTRIDVSEDAPVLDCAYKLQEYDRRPTAKRSPNKRHLPGRRQVFRRYDATGHIEADIIARSVETISGEPLLQSVMKDGRRLHESPSLDQIRQRCRHELATLPPAFKTLDRSQDAPVIVSESLRCLARQIEAAPP